MCAARRRARCPALLLRCVLRCVRLHVLLLWVLLLHASARERRSGLVHSCRLACRLRQNVEAAVCLCGCTEHGRQLSWLLAHHLLHVPPLLCTSSTCCSTHVSLSVPQIVRSRLVVAKVDVHCVAGEAAQSTCSSRLQMVCCVAKALQHVPLPLCTSGQLVTTWRFSVVGHLRSCTFCMQRGCCAGSSSCSSHHLVLCCVICALQHVPLLLLLLRTVYQRTVAHWILVGGLLLLRSFSTQRGRCVGSVALRCTHTTTIVGHCHQTVGWCVHAVLHAVR